MKRKKMMAVVSAMVVFAFLLTLTPALAKKSATDVIHWKGQLSYAPSKTGFGPFAVGQAGVGAQFVMWSNWLKEASGGRLVIEWAEPNSIFPVQDADLAIGKNVVQVATGYGGYYRGRIPETDIETGGVFLWENEAQVFECLHKYGLYHALQKVYEKHNIKWLPNHCNAIVGIATTFPAPNPEALKGKKIRALGMWADYVRSLGGTPVSLPWGEMYMALKLGTIDGAMGGAGILEELKLKEVVKSFVASPIISTALSSIMINLDAFNALPKDLQQLLQRDTPYVTYALSSNWYNQCTWCLKNAQTDYGVNIERWSPDDVKKLTDLVASKIYPKIAARSKGNAKLLKIVLKQMKDYGRIK